MTYGLHLVNNLFGLLVVVDRADVFGGLPAIFTYDANPCQIDLPVLAAAIAALVAIAWRGRGGELARLLRGARYAASEGVTSS